MPKLLFAVLLILVSTLDLSSASAAGFSFLGEKSLDDMRAYVTTNVPLGTSRDQVRAAFAGQGGAKTYRHPEFPSVEKYVYDINLCSLYVWRWNISANYAPDQRLTQIYINGEPVYSNGDRLVDPTSRAKPGVKQAIIKAIRPRPEASKGEKALTYIIFDVNTASPAISDEFVIGAGPTRADPLNLGRLHAYNSVERWRSIFDAEPAAKIVSYPGPCN